MALLDHVSFCLWSHRETFLPQPSVPRIVNSVWNWLMSSPAWVYSPSNLVIQFPFFFTASLPFYIFIFLIWKENPLSFINFSKLLVLTNHLLFKTVFPCVLTAVFTRGKIYMLLCPFLLEINYMEIYWDISLKLTS